MKNGNAGWPRVIGVKSDTGLVRAGLRLVRNGILALACGVAVILLPAPGQVHSTASVDLVLVLALDVSGSIDNREFALQQRGLAKAFRNVRIVEAIQRGALKRIAVAVVQWAGREKQAVAVPWAIIENDQTAHAFAERLAAMPRIFDNSETHIAGVIDFAARYALSAPVAAPRRAIDISGDGMDNVLYSTHRARDRALAAGLTINGLTILNETPELDSYYRFNVIGGPNAFVIKAKEYEDFADAILRKLLREINPPFIS
ncbi:MAG: DUF1194 domain-containing protein [Hyphomicrobiaceae bacterium]